MLLFKLERFGNVDEFLQKVATIRGKLKKGGIVEMLKLQLELCCMTGMKVKSPIYTLPPIRNEGEILEAAIVSDLGKEFTVDEVYKGDSSFIGSLSSAEDFKHVVLSSLPPNMNEQMLEENAKKEEEAAAAVDQEMTGVEEHSGDTVSSINRQNDKFYTAEGILDPRKRRGEKNRRKEQKASMMDEEYDFKIDYFNRESDAKFR